MNIEERIRVWRNNIPPPVDNALAHTACVTMQVNDVEICGEVRFDEHLQTYVFQLTEAISENGYRLIEVTVSEESYIQCRQLVRDQLGVYVTRGIHTRDCLPKAPDQQLPASLRPTILHTP